MSEKHGDVLIDNLDTERFSKDIEIVKKDKVYLQEISDKICSEFTNHLDKLMQTNYQLIRQDKMDDKAIERNFLELTNLLYFIGDKLESLGIELTVASARNQEIFNDIFQKAQGTIADKKAEAEQGSKYEYFLKAVYESVYKRIKMKMDAGYEMVSSLKRVIMKRCAEMELTKSQSYSKNRAAFDDQGD